MVAWLSANWGNIASVIGVVIALIGFRITIRDARKSKSAAERAEEAVHQVKRDLLRLDTIAEFSSAMTIMEEIKRLHRAEAWAVLPDRYTILKQKLISIRASNLGMSDDHKSIIQGAIQHFTGIDRQVERALANARAPASVARLNEIASEQIDRLTEVLVVLRNDMRG